MAASAYERHPTYRLPFDVTPSGAGVFVQIQGKAGYIQHIRKVLLWKPTVAATIRADRRTAADDGTVVPITPSKHDSGDPDSQVTPAGTGTITTVGGPGTSSDKFFELNMAIDAIYLTGLGGDLAEEIRIKGVDEYFTLHSSASSQIKGFIEWFETPA